MHVGHCQNLFQCKNEFVDEWKIQENKNILTCQIHQTEYLVPSVPVKSVTSKKYLGDIIMSDGSNTENIMSRKKRGFGIVRKIVDILDKMCLGPYMFKNAVLKQYVKRDPFI